MNMETIKTCALAILAAVILFSTRTNAEPTQDTDRSSARPRQEQTEPNRGLGREEIWEYKVEEYSQAYPKSKGLQGWLNEHGRQGWEASGSPYLPRWTFKRRVARL